jgi:hypothetical protein
MGSRQTAVAGDADRAFVPSRPTYIARTRMRLNALVARLFAPIDISSIVVFRIAFGLIMVWEMNRYITYGWIDSIYLEPEFLFPYQNFEWVQSWRGDWLHVHFYALAALGLMISLGLWYRIATVLFFAGFAYIFLLDKGHYLNHLYLATLISFLMIFVPANRSFSIDAWRDPKLRRDTAPTWALVLLASQFAVVYIFGGIAKANGDWLRGEPMRRWLANETQFPVLGRWFTEEWMVYAISYAGLLLDLFIVPLLLWSRTRWFAVIALVLFHRFNAEMFSIGIFPTFATAAIVLFLPPDLPRRIVSIFKSSGRWRGNTTRIRQENALDPAASPVGFTQRPAAQRLVVILLFSWIAIQMLVPLRFFLYPGNPAWTDQGDRFAWRMMLHSKVGEINFVVTDPASGESWTVDPADYLTRTQVGFLVGQPDMILQFSHFLADQWREQGHEDVEVRANTLVSLNSRERVPIVDPTVDLAAEELGLGNAEWITSLDEELERLESGASAE